MRRIQDPAWEKSVLFLTAFFFSCFVRSTETQTAYSTETPNTADVLSTTFEELRAGMAERGVEKVIPILYRGARLAGNILKGVDLVSLPKPDIGQTNGR